MKWWNEDITVKERPQILHHVPYSVQCSIEFERYIMDDLNWKKKWREGENKRNEIQRQEEQQRMLLEEERR